MRIFNKKGVALMVVMAFTLVMVILAGTILAILTSSGRLNEHQLRRTLAFYSANAGVQYVLELLRQGTTVSLIGGGANCTCCADPNSECDVIVHMTQNDRISTVTIHVGTQYGSAAGELEGTRPVTSSVVYTMD
jgi:Tfp pilus assembly protein PilX